VEAKMRRAREHHQALGSEIAAFIKRNPYRVAVEFEPQSGWHIAYLRVIEEPPLHISVLAGEFAYQCVSALNHIVWELAARKLGRKRVFDYKNGIQFPVTSSKEWFHKQALVHKGYVSRASLAVIEELQPYKGRHGMASISRDSLWLIKDIADSDKHRVLVPRFSQLILEDLRFVWDEEAASGPTIEPILKPGHRLNDGTHLARIRFATGNSEANVRMDNEPATDVLLGSRDWMLTVRELRNAIAYMNTAIRKLSKLFPPRPKDQ
jgi:hypothetical protein